VAGDEYDLLGRQVIGDRDGLFRIASVVSDVQGKLFAVDAASIVQLLHGHFGTPFELLAEGGIARPKPSATPAIRNFLILIPLLPC
jgi:hypothetical protein